MVIPLLNLCREKLHIYKIHCRTDDIITKNGCCGNTDIFLPVYSADGIIFTVALLAKLELEVHFVKEFHIQLKSEVNKK